VRILVALAILLAATSAAVAQQQENKLMDRLLRPDLTLANSAQNKKFTNTQTAATFNKPARTRTFSVARKPAQRTFSGERTFTPRQFAAPRFRAGDSAANIATRTQLTKNDAVFVTSAAPASTLVAPESNETAPAREYAGTRPFLGKGKSQKALSAQDKPLTIEQVRELLNKSK
jgi:hypothetical protein